MNTIADTSHSIVELNDQVSDNVIENFKKLVRKAIFLTPDEERYFQAIPDDKWRRIFSVNFNNNYAYADRVILKKFRDIKSTDMPRVEREKNKIKNLDKAIKMLNQSFNAGEPVLFITDIDNDGSFSQSIIHEFLKADPSTVPQSHVEYTQVVNGNASRGFTVDHLDKLVQMKGINTQRPFLIVTADNGINSREEQIKIQTKYPQAKLIVTDHHQPDPGLVVQENANTIIFNPHYQPTSDFFKKFNISGAATIGVLLSKTLEKRLSPEELSQVQKNLDNITNLSRIANLLDYVYTDPMDKPEKDYVVTKFLKLQGLMNVNNSLNRIILDGVDSEALDKLQSLIPQLNREYIQTEARNIQDQNYVARILLKIYQQYKFQTDFTNLDFSTSFMIEINSPSNFEGLDLEVNKNFIEQLRPVIFSLSVDDDKSPYMEELCEAMVNCYESIRLSEKNISAELRKGEAMITTRLPHSSIGYADPVILKSFNRKLLGKIYNDENPGFLALLDSNRPERVGGSFRSLYDISSILTEQDRSNLEFELGVRILTPGHERAAGFIIESNNPDEDPITEDKIKKINHFINDKIEALRAEETQNPDTYLLTDLSAIGLIDRINQTIRGSISNFERIVPLLKITPNTIWTDSYSTKQYSMEEIIREKKFGYISINTDFHGGTVIVPIELIRRLVHQGYEDYLAINYMDGGVFMAERLISPANAPLIRDLRGTNAKSQLIDQVFSTDLKDSNCIHLNRDQIKDNPFFKYNDYGKSDFNLFERMVIGILDSSRVNDKPVDVLSVFDVEANGFGNGKLMNFGSMNYSIVPDRFQTADPEFFKEHLFQNQQGREYLLTDEQKKALNPVVPQDKIHLPTETRRRLLMIRFPDHGDAHSYDMYYEYPDSAEKQWGKLQPVNNHALIGDQIVYNREIQAEMLAYLVKDVDFKVPQEMTNLTGITQEHLDRYGKLTSVVDQELHDYYQNKTILFGAHNTPYDARILRANTPLMYEVLKHNGIYDSALFCKEDKLAYDAVDLATFQGIDILKGIHFYDNPQSDFSLTDFLVSDDDGYYPDRTGNYLLSRENGVFSLVNKVKHDIVKIPLTPPPDYLGKPYDFAQSTLIAAKKQTDIPNISVKYSVEKLSEQWMTHALLLSNEQFNIKHVSLNQPKYAPLKAFENQLIFFQDNYLFDSSIDQNIYHFSTVAFIESSNDDQSSTIATPDTDLMFEFVEEFLKLNADIQQKFTDSWMYKQVLNILEPQAREDRSNDYIDLVHYQTHIPKEKIRKILVEAKTFKQKYGIDHLLQHEGHVNGPWSGDHKGDIAFEDKLTLALLARRMYNPYSRDLSDAIRRFQEAACKAKLAFDLSDSLSEDAAQDAYSYRQGLLYQRDHHSLMINSIQSKEQMLNNSSEQIITFKLANDVLPAETFIRAVTRDGVQLTRQQIEADADLLNFIVVNEQSRHALSNLEQHRSELLKEILEANTSLCLQYKQELAQRYRYVEVNKREAQLKRLKTICLDMMEGDMPKRGLKASSFADIFEQDYDSLESILFNQYQLKNQQDPDRQPERLNNWTHVQNFLNEIKTKREPSTLEKALKASSSDRFKNMSDIRDLNFLDDIKIKPLNPVKTLLVKHPTLRMINAKVEAQQQLVQSTLLTPKKTGRKMGI